METNSQKAEKSNSRSLPWRVGWGFGGAVLLLAIIGTILLQFFLQLTLAAGSQSTSEFWSQGIVIGLIWGSLIGVPLAVVVGIFAGVATWLIKKQPTKMNE